MGEKRPGCSLSEDSNRKGIELTGTTTSDIFIEKEGSKTSIAGISLAVSDKSYSFPNRQYNRPVLSCENEWWARSGWGGGGGHKKQLFNRIRRKNSSRNQVSCTLWIKITEEYFPSSKNVAADWQLGNSKDHSELELLSQLFHRIWHIKGRA